MLFYDQLKFAGILPKEKVNDITEYKQKPRKNPGISSGTKKGGSPMSICDSCDYPVKDGEKCPSCDEAVEAELPKGEFSDSNSALARKLDGFGDSRIRIGGT